ncbi:hypothetical protein GCU56_03905 [Geodermatophilus sabuli]|uniref:Uncharacterized protein n=1 Tax=Geodermatophilus sabuli TaxID=1564158 RepID=A0A7K3VWJ3_9ACTN|nr:hypothetical protein [Geodermatophilus sabuli]NEK57016.1 hypothetical protein [Geodermatophilus sabuli]
MTELDDLIAWINSDQPKSVPELQRAADVLGRHLRTGETRVPEARLRVAVALERLGA